MKHSDLDIIKVREFSNLSLARSLLIIISEWVGIVCCFALNIFFENIVLLLFSIFFISTRMYGLYSLSHEACHFHISKNKKWNDIVGSIFISWPIFIDIKEMRVIHFRHHKKLQTKDDPEMKHLQYDEFKFPLTKKKFLWIFLQDILGINFLKYRIFKIQWYQSLLQISLSQMVFYFLVVFYFYISGNILYFVVLWIVPYMTFYQAFNRIRLYSEHFNLGRNEIIKTRTLHLSRISSFFFTPYGLGYHAEHHLYPSVPFYNLRKLHYFMFQNTDYLKEFELENNYFKLINKIWTNDGE